MIEFYIPRGNRELFHVTVEAVMGYPMKSSVKCSHCGKYNQVLRQNVGTGKFMKGAGITLGMLEALQIRYEEVYPQSWQKAFGLVSRRGEGLTPTQKKKRHVAKAEKLWPEHAGNITLAVVDAMLLAEFGRMANR